MSALTVAEVLDGAADLLTPEGAWTQGRMARRQTGHTAWSLFDDSAVCFCAIGAMIRVSGSYEPDLKEEAFAEALGFASASRLASWNDDPGRTQAEVVAKLREAAALAREARA